MKKYMFAIPTRNRRAIAAQMFPAKAMSAKAIHEAAGKAILARAMPQGTCRTPLSATINADTSKLVGKNGPSGKKVSLLWGLLTLHDY